MPDPMSLVTYFDFGPSFAASATPELRAWAAPIGSAGGKAEVTLLTEVGRPERLAVVETWTDAERLNAHQVSRAPLAPQTAAGLAAEPDQRVGEAFSVGAAQPAEAQAVYVLVHVDVVPFNLDAVGEWLRAQADAARSAPGGLRYDVWRQVGRPNHFTVIQVWSDPAAYAHHVESAATRAFRANVLTVKGALYDERLYRRVDCAAVAP